MRTEELATAPIEVHVLVSQGPSGGRTVLARVRELSLSTGSIRDRLIHGYMPLATRVLGAN